MAKREGEGRYLGLRGFPVRTATSCSVFSCRELKYSAMGSPAHIYAYTHTVIDTPMDRAHETHQSTPEHIRAHQSRADEENEQALLRVLPLSPHSPSRMTDFLSLSRATSSMVRAKGACRVRDPHTQTHKQTKICHYQCASLLHYVM